MSSSNSIGAAFAVAGGLAALAVAALRSGARFLVWQWRAKKSGSAIRSFGVALGAQLGQRVILERDIFFDAASSLGDYSYINQYSSVENAAIGKFCSIARGVMIGPADHDYSKLSTHPFWHQPFYGFAVGASHGDGAAAPRTCIGDDVWIGCNAVIRRGVTVQRGAVIGAGSVVTRDIGPYEIWAGVPARKIKQRFDDATIELLMAADWCSLDKETINARIIPGIGEVRELTASGAYRSFPRNREQH